MVGTSLEKMNTISSKDLFKRDPIIYTLLLILTTTFMINKLAFSQKIKDFINKTN